MKYIALFTAVALVALGCQDTVLVQKEIVHDTIVVKEPVVQTLTGEIRIDTVSFAEYRAADTVHSVDTVWQFIRDVDSVFVERVDTIRITETEFVYDTIYIASHQYLDTVYVFAYGRSTFRVHPDLIPIIIEFNTQMRERELVPYGDMLLYMSVYGRLEPPASWSSWGYEGVTGQWSIEIDPILTPENALTPIAREMARRQLGYKYTNDLGPMDPQFDENIVQMNSPQEVKDIYWNNLFK
jgi:hypothetical protein